MSLTDIARDFPGLMINIKLEDLLKSQEVLIRKAREEERQKLLSEFSILDDVVSRQVVMKKLDIDASTLWRWEQDKIITPYKVGNRIYYKAQDINRAITKK